MSERERTSVCERKSSACEREPASYSEYEGLRRLRVSERYKECERTSKEKSGTLRVRD